MIYKNVSKKTLEDTIKLANKHNLEIIQKEGSLLDEYLIYNNKLNFGKSKKAYKYIIFREIFLNEWSSRQDLILTDDEELTKYFIEYRED